MKIPSHPNLFLLASAFAASTLSAQALFVPSGTSGIGNSTTSSVGVGTSAPIRPLTINNGEMSLIPYTASNTAFFNISDVTGNDGSGKTLVIRGLDSGGTAGANIGTISVEANTALFNGVVGVGTSSPGGLSSQPNVGYGSPVVKRLGVLDDWGGQNTPVVAVFKAVDGGGSSEVNVLSKNIGGPTTLLRGRTGGADVYWLTYDGDSYLSGKFGIGTTSPSGLSSLPDVGYGGPVVKRFGVLDDWGGQTSPVTAVFKAVDGSGSSELNVLSKNFGGPTTLLRGRSSGTDVYWVTMGGDAYFAGNVGIGTTSPGAKLGVNGTIRAKEVVVTTSGWSDYVFAKDYRLAPLSEVEAHIEKEGHLPGIPSAAEVEAGGVSIGEMQAKLLAKVEELTLHLIAQEKRFTATEEENSTRLRAVEQENALLRQQLSQLR